jgi:type VI secretion system protein ImpL
MRNKFLIAGLIVLSSSCIALVGWIAVLTGKSVLWAAVPAAVLVCGLLVVAVYGLLRSRYGASGLEAGLLEQGRAQVRAARPDQRAQSEQMQKDFERAVRDLKSSRLGRTGRDALYLLPWYAIIGPSGAGKTTALRNSGLRFPSMRNQENVKVKGLGGTRNCDFWLTNDAVLLDTAGRWSTEDDDHHEWLGFLQLLRKHRGRKPLNGLIAAISIGDVVNASESDIDALAQRMRDRLEEVTSELRVAIPVYVLFTKCDLLEGFVEMFGGLRATEREQILGFTVPLVRSSDSAPGDLFENYFGELSDGLRGVALARMGAERGAQQRQLVYAFPEQFVAMRRKLGLFVERLFEANVYREAVPLRGVYFSSGTQEGRPFNLLFEPRSGEPAELLDQKSYFLRELFMHVIFEDSSIASASQSELRRQRLLRAGLTGVLGLVTLAIGIVPASVFLRSRTQLSRTHELVSACDGSAQAAPVAPALSTAGHDLLGELASYERGAPSFFSSLGMYTGARVLPVLHRFTAQLIRRELVQPALGRDQQAMTDFGLRYEAMPHALPSPAEHDAFYEALKLHLLMSMPRLPAEYASWVQERLVERWGSAGLAALGTQLARSYVSDAQRYPELAFARDVDGVRRVRAALNRSSAAQQALDAIVAHVGTLGYDIDLQKLTGYTTALSGARRVRGAYTRRGYEQVVRELFATGAPEHVDELWVLGLEENQAAGPAHSAERAARLAELETLYYRAYAQEWRSFIDGVRTRAPKAGGAEALGLLSELTTGEPTPLGRLFIGVAENVRLPPPPAADGKAGEQAAGTDLLSKVWNQDKQPHKRAAAPSAPRFGASDLAAAFESFINFGAPPEGTPSGSRVPLPFDAYREQLAYLRDALQLRADNPGENAQLEARLQTALVAVRGLIDTQPPAFRPVFEVLLWPPIRGLHEGASREGASWTAGKWCSDIVSPFEQSLSGHYPFNPNGRDARIEDLDAFYRPADGLLWKFTSGALTELVQANADGFGFTPKYEKGGGLYGQGLLEFLNHSRAISQAFYPGNGGKAKVDFSVRIHGASSKVDTTTFSVGGKQIGYQNGPLTWQPMTWPGPDPSRGASFSVRGRAIRAGNDIEGQWGLFRLLESGEVTRSGDDTISVVWRLPADDVRVWIEVRPSGGSGRLFDAPDRSARLLRLLRAGGVSAPHRIAHNQAACTP